MGSLTGLRGRSVNTYDARPAAVGSGSAPGAPGSNPDALVPAFFIDPANVSGVASDSNSGVTANNVPAGTGPLLTYAALTQKWGNTTSPYLTTNTLITYLSSSVGNADPISITPTLVGVSLTFQGRPTVVHTGVLGAVTPKLRTTPQLLNANLGTPVGPLTGLMIQNTTAGKISYAWVHADLGANVAELTQPLTPSVIGPPNLSPPNTEVDTWAPSDTYQVVSFPFINVWNAGSLYELTNFDVNVNPMPGIRFYQIGILDPSGPTYNDIYVGRYVAFTECIIERVMNGVVAGTQDILIQHQNSWWQGGIFRPSAAQSFFYGGAISFGLVVDHGSWPNNNFDGDVIIHIAPFLPNNISGAMFGAAYTASKLPLTGGLNFVLPFFDGTNLAVLWGPGSVDVQGSDSTLAYQSPAAGPTGSLVFTGTLTMNGAVTANTFNPATGAWAAPIALNPGNLDKALGTPGFGGTAYQPQTGLTITNATIAFPANP